MHRGTGTGGLYADYGGNGSPPENRAQPNATAAERAPIQCTRARSPVRDQRKQRRLDAGLQALLLAGAAAVFMGPYEEWCAHVHTIRARPAAVALV